MPQLRLIITILVAGLAAGCGNASDHSTLITTGSTSIAGGGISVKNGTVVARASGAPDAVINQAGELRIDDKLIATDAGQQSLLKQYYASALNVREHGIATGMAGANIAGTAIKSVATGLVTGNTDQIDKDVNAKAQDVEAAAMKICDDLVDLKAAQDGLGAQLPACAPYAHNLGDRSATDCRKHSKD